jgi:hypothetical protein
MIRIISIRGKHGVWQLISRLDSPAFQKMTTITKWRTKMSAEADSQVEPSGTLWFFNNSRPSLRNILVSSAFSAS